MKGIENMSIELELVLRIALAAVLGGIIGLERELKNHSAGLRTHILVAVGSALIVIVSRFAFIDGASGLPMGDPGRIAAQVVSGIGFIGAGTIMRTQNRVKGLTTAATLWICSALGLAAGTGLYIIGISAAVLSVLVLVVLDRLQRTLSWKNFRTLTITFYTDPKLIGNVNQVFSDNNVSLRSIDMVKTDEDEVGTTSVRLHLRLPPGLTDEALSMKLSSVPGLVYSEWENHNRHTYP